MKYLAAISLLVLITTPLTGLAQEKLVPCTGVENCDFQKLVTLLKNIFDFIIKWLAVPIATAVIGYGGFLMVISPADPGKRDAGKKLIWAAVWGLVIVLAAWLIVDTVLDFFLANESQNPLN